MNSKFKNITENVTIKDIKTKKCCRFIIKNTLLEGIFRVQQLKKDTFPRITATLEFYLSINGFQSLLFPMRHFSEGKQPW